MKQRRILIISLDTVSQTMAGPAIRCWEFARVLGPLAQVTLAIPNEPALEAEGFDQVQYDAGRLALLARESDLLILSGHALWFYPFLKDSEVPIVVDTYDPFLLESLPLLAGHSDEDQVDRYSIILDALTDLLLWGDFFLCASEKQRDYWLGWLNALNRINPLTYRSSPDLRNLLDVVPFGLPDQPPTKQEPVLKGVHPGISAGDRVILWGGGVYNWFDPLTLIQAMARVSAQHPDVKLFFLGVDHPTHGDSGSEMVQRAIELSRQLDLLDRTVFFNDWVPYQKRQDYLLEADLGVSLHFAHIETHFSFRTRLLDYIWASLPMLVTRGDVLSDLVESENLGWVVDFEDLDAVTAAILSGLEADRDQYRPRFAAVARSLTWEQVLHPLVAFCQDPRKAADHHFQNRDAHALSKLKLISLMDAQRRDLSKRDEQIATLKVRIANLEAELEAIKRGRVMRLMNRVDRLVKGSARDDD
jgi:glycosyltransferase involved in cell wall biosynthesis